MMDSMRGRTALVTGASAGIGKAFAEVFAARGWNVVLAARRFERLEALAGELSSKHGISAAPIAADLASPDGAKRLMEEIGARGLAIDGLVNNAGYGVKGYYARTAWKDQEDFLRVLVVAPCELAHAVLPGMVARRFGRIVNVASLAGLMPGTAGHTLYAASKAFMIRFSQSLLVENRQHNVLTTALCPGLTYSEFHDVTGTREKVSKYGKAWWSKAEDVALTGYEGVMRGRSIVVTGRRSKQIAAIMKMLPEPLALGIVARQSRSFRSE
jgi:uncharacterized protein